VKIRALVFDFDGSILETEAPELLAWQEIFETHGVSLSTELWCSYVGAGAEVFDIYGHLQELCGRPIVREEVRASQRTRFWKLLEQARPREGVEHWLEEAERLGLGLAVASSSSRSWVTGHLERYGLLVRFRGVHCREDVTQAKPAPDVYLAALESLGVGPTEAIAIEDSPNGLAAAKAAGLYCVVVPNEVTRHLSFEGADLVLDSLAELSLTELLARLECWPEDGGRAEGRSASAPSGPRG
jgi:HAD superfamily hydrolase (TIGR01509 family)